MGWSRTMSQVESDIVALRAAADRAGVALACLFSTSDEFEAAVIRVRRAQGAFDAPRAHRARLAALTGLLAVAFVLV